MKTARARITPPGLNPDVVTGQLRDCMCKPQFIPLLEGADNSSVFSQGCCEDEIKAYALSAQPRPVALVSDSSVVTGLIIIIFRKNAGDEVSFTDASPR